jgi:hypothetical protein
VYRLPVYAYTRIQTFVCGRGASRIAHIYPSV